MSTMRLDRYLSLSGEYSRREAVELLKSGQVQVNGSVIRDGKMKVSEADVIAMGGIVLHHDEYRYFLMNKPAGVLTAATDAHCQTVMDLLPPALLHRGVLPVGRLDKDTTGLLFLTNDGALAHKLLSPKNHVWKQYLVTVGGRLTDADVLPFQEGMNLGDFTAKPAQMEILKVEAETSRASVMIREGKYHQVKRMFSHIGHEVLTLHRAAFGSLALPDDLHFREYRELTPAEVELLKKDASSAEAADKDE